MDVESSQTNQQEKDYRRLRGGQADKINQLGPSRQEKLAAKANKLFVHHQQHQKAGSAERKPRLGRNRGIEGFKTLQNPRPMTADRLHTTSGGPKKPAAAGGSLKAFEAARFKKPLNSLLANAATLQKVGPAAAAAPAMPTNSFRIPVKKATHQYKTRKGARPGQRPLDLDFQYNTKPLLVRQTQLTGYSTQPRCQKPGPDPQASSFAPPTQETNGHMATI